MVLDSSARTPLTARILEGESTTIVTTATTQPGDLGAETEVCQLPAGAEGRVALTAWVDLLCERAYNEILVEAGPTLAGAMLKEGWVDQLVVYQDKGEGQGSGGRRLGEVLQQVHQEAHPRGEGQLLKQLPVWDAFRKERLNGGKFPCGETLWEFFKLSTVSFLNGIFKSKMF